MQINKIQISNFGKLNDINIDLEPGINIIKGKNEAGKSTLADFVRCTYYGVSKNKNGKTYSDFEKYSPWNNNKFAGRIDYEINDQKYSIYRDFTKNKATITDEYGADVSDNFNKTKSKGAEIGFEQFKMDEETFENSTLVRQNQIAVDTTSQNSIIQKIGNAIQTGDESLSYDEIIKKLEKVLYDEVGTDRTTTKPKYTLKKEVSRLEVKQIELESASSRSGEIKKQKDELKEKNIALQEEDKTLRELRDIKFKYEKEKNDARNKYELEQKYKKEQKEKELAKIKKRKVIVSILIVLMMIISISCIIYLKSNYYYIAIPLVLGVILLLINILAGNKEEPQVIEKPFSTIEDEITRKENKEIKKLALKKPIKKSFVNKNSEMLNEEISNIENEVAKNELEIHKLKIDEDSIKEKVADFNEVVEDLEYNRSELEKVLKKEEIINIGLSLLKDSYEEIKKKIIPSIEEDIKYTISKTTNGKYSEIKYNDVYGLICKNEYGELIPLDKLSLGTMDQIYLGFRLAIADKYENLPLIFDEAFVYFDDERLENLLKSLIEISDEKQIIILSCSERETNILEKLKVKYKNIFI